MVLHCHQLSAIIKLCWMICRILTIDIMQLRIISWQLTSVSLPLQYKHLSNILRSGSRGITIISAQSDPGCSAIAVDFNKSHSIITLHVTHITTDTTETLSGRYWNIFDIARRDDIINRWVGPGRDWLVYEDVSFLPVCVKMYKTPLHSIILRLQTAVHCWHLPESVPGNDPLVMLGRVGWFLQWRWKVLCQSCLLIQLLFSKCLGRCERWDTDNLYSLTVWQSDCIKTLHHMHYVCTGQQHHIKYM